MYLLDTNVVSEMRKAAKANRHVSAWAKNTPANTLFISAITILVVRFQINVADEAALRCA